MHAAVHNPVSLSVFRLNLEFGLHLVCRSADEMQPHRGAPAAEGGIERRGKISIRGGRQLPFNGHDRVIVIVNRRYRTGQGLLLLSSVQAITAGLAYA